MTRSLSRCAGTVDRPLARPLLMVASLVYLLLPWPDEVAVAQQHNVQYYRAGDGMPQAQVLSVYQDSRGYMWFGTYGGAARYDGGNFLSLTRADGLVGNIVRAIAEDSHGMLLLGTEHGVSIYDDGIVKALEPADGEPIHDVNGLFADGDAVWVATDSGVVLIRGQDVIRYAAEDGLPDGPAYSVIRDRSNRVWISSSGGLLTLVGHRFQAVGGALQGRVVRTVIEGFDGRIWVGTESGLFVGDGTEFARVEDAVFSNSSVSTILSSASDGRGTLWFGTQGGVMRADGTGFALLTASNGLSSNTIWTAHVDREHNVWLGTDDGACKLVPGPFTAFTTMDGLPHDFVRDIAEDADGRIWMSTRGGIGVMEPDGRIWKIDGSDGLPATRGYAIAPLPNGSVLFGTTNGLIHWGSGVIATYGTADGLPSERVSAILVRRVGEVWVGTRRGVARWNEGKTETFLTEEQGFPPAQVMDFEEDAEGRLWIATYDSGLYLWDDSDLRPWPLPEVPERLALWSLAADPGGGMWVGTNGLGAFRIRGSEILHLSTANGLTNDFIWQVIVGGNGDAWFYTNRGLDRWDGEAFEHFDTGDGLVDLEGSVDSALLDSRGTLWFGSGRGVVRYSPEGQGHRVPPPVVLQELSADGQPLPLDGEIVVPQSHGSMTFSFAGLSFRDEKDTRFRYRLLGLDERWSAPTSERHISYASLPPGTYTFEVEADHGGLKSIEPARVQFRVKPGLLATLWFRLLAAGALIAAVVGFAYLRGRRVQAEKLRLEGIVEERTGELARSEERFRTALINSPTVVSSQDLALHYTWVSNPLWGRGPDQVIGRSDVQIIENDQEARAIATIKKGALENAAGKQRQVKVTLDGKAHYFDLAVEPLRDAEDNVLGITSAVTDVTEQQQLEDQLRHSQKMEAIGQLAGGIAHDFNNLLTGITGYTQLALSELPSDSSLAADCKEVLLLCDRAVGLTRQLLAFSRRQPLEQITLNPNSLFGELTKLLQRLIGEMIELEFLPDAKLGHIRVDSGQIEQVLVNLAVNARDAMPNGGKLTIGTSSIDLDEDTARLQFELEAGTYAMISVTDTGCGMSVETQERIFEPFFTTKEVGKGTGLGLATVYGIIKQHDGNILVTSEEGKGTTFNVLLPIVERLGDAQADDRPTVVPTGTETILVVEDDDAVRSVVARALSRQGYTLRVASDPDEAAALYRSRSAEIDLLLTDVVMPGSDGLELCQRLRALTPSLKVLFMSGYTDKSVCHGGLLAPGTPFIQKPFSPEALVRRVRDVLDEAA